MQAHTGELAALGTSLLFSFSAILFTFSSREIGAPLVNRTRLLAAFLFVSVVHWLTFGQPFPVNAAPERWLWLALSGFIGFTLGDSFLFQAFVMVGPRIAMLVMAFSPALSIIFAWVFLGEVLTIQHLLIIGIIIAGIAWVVSEKPAVIENQALVPGDARKRLIGLLFAVGGASGQAGGLILSKIGLAGDFPAFSGTWIRILAAVITVWIVTIARGGLTVSLQTLRSHPRAVRFVSIGAFIGPVVAVWLSLVAVQQSPVGIASALTSLAPIFLLPISYFVFGEKITPRAVIGTMVVIAATAVLFLSK